MPQIIWAKQVISKPLRQPPIHVFVFRSLCLNDGSLCCDGSSIFSTAKDAYLHAKPFVETFGNLQATVCQCVIKLLWNSWTTMLNFTHECIDVCPLQIKQGYNNLRLLKSILQVPSASLYDCL